MLPSMQMRLVNLSLFLAACLVSLPLFGQQPDIVSFAIVPATVRPGQQATLSWVTRGATAVTIDNGVGVQSRSGTITVIPIARTTYTLKAATGSFSTSASVTVSVMLAPAVVVSALPPLIVQREGASGATATYTVSNIGGSAANVSLFQSGNFFSQSPTSFTLAPGASQVVTITASALAAGAFEGKALIGGMPTPFPLEVPVRVFSAPRSAGIASAKPLRNRVDLFAGIGTSPTSVVMFRNTGDEPLTGVLTANAAWLIPQTGLITIPAGATAGIGFAVDRTKRTSDFGSETATLSFTYLRGETVAVSSTTVVDTVRPQTMAIGAPPLKPGEVALFVPGAGHVTGSVGTFLSDLSVLALPGTDVSDATLFYSSIDGASRKAALLPLVAGEIALADVVSTVFGSDAQIGTLQIRSASATKLAVNTNVFNSSNPAGTYGTALPVFRSDRSVPSGGRLILTGLRSDSSNHTNLFIQETAGTGVTVRTEFLAADGLPVGSRVDSLDAFALAQLNSAVPAGAVAAELTNVDSFGGRFVAFATPVDEASGDNWSVVDWSQQLGYSGTETVIIPVAGVLKGANSTFFRTDVAITNASSTSGSGMLRYITRNGDVIDRVMTIGPRQTALLDDVAGKTFGAESGNVGFLIFTPAAGSFAITSRTYTTMPGKPGTFGTAVPTIAASNSLRKGDVRAFGAIDDASLATVIAGQPATFRTNFAIAETSGHAVRVRVTLHYKYAAGMPLQTSGTAQKEYALGPNDFVLLNGLATEILGPARETLGDLHGLEADFQVTDGDGSVIVFTSAVDNGTGDSVLRTDG